MSDQKPQTKVFFRVERENGDSFEINLPLDHTWVQYTINFRRDRDGGLLMVGPNVEILKD